MKNIVLSYGLVFLCLIASSQNIIKPVIQPDADGKIIKGREGTHHWQKYMENADLSDYHHAPEESIEKFNDFKYGIRIHWGIYSIVHGKESWTISRYTNKLPYVPAYKGFYHELYKGWYPSAFDAEEWTDMFVENGFKFFVFTTKHHDGFSMYDTKTIVNNKIGFFTNDSIRIVPFNGHYSIMETPFKRDVTGELVESARKKGLGIGLYYSHPDWFDADFRFDRWNPLNDTTYSPEKYPDSWERFKARHKEQIREILTNYGDVDMLSFDMWFPEFVWEHMQEIAYMSRKIQPNCMLRWRGIGNFGDYHTPENYIPGDESQGTMAWQVIHTLSTRNIFSYEPDAAFIRGGDWIVSKLIDIVSKGGNLMVGVGPDIAGYWHPKVLESLEYAGNWLKINGEAIYGTRPCENTREGNVFYTRNKENTITYAIVEGWPGESLFVNHIKPQKGSVVFLLGHNKPIKWKKNKTGILIEISTELQQEENRPCMQAYVFKIIGKQFD